MHVAVVQHDIAWQDKPRNHAVVESMLDPDPSPYVRSLSPDRFDQSAWDWDSASRSARAHYESYYGLKAPGS